jgi:putative transposase
MPTGLRRYYGDDHLHYLTCTCYHRQPWLASAQSRDLFLEILEDVRQRYQFVVVGYVVMPDHIHLLISESERGTPSTVMQVLKQRSARHLLRKKRRKAEGAELCVEQTQRVWQRRFYDFNIWSERKRVEKLRYIHRNPVRRGLVLEPEQWPWSSYRSYKYEEPGVVKINQWPQAVMKVRKVASPNRPEQTQAIEQNPVAHPKHKARVAHPLRPLQRVGSSECGPLRILFFLCPSQAVSVRSEPYC